MVQIAVLVLGQSHSIPVLTYSTPITCLKPRCTCKDTWTVWLKRQAKAGTMNCEVWELCQEDISKNSCRVEPKISAGTLLIWSHCRIWNQCSSTFSFGTSGLTFPCAAQKSNGSVFPLVVATSDLCPVRTHLQTKQWFARMFPNSQLFFVHHRFEPIIFVSNKRKGLTCPIRY